MTKQKPFVKLERKIERAYVKKGFSPARARHIGQATAGEIAHAKAIRVKNHIPDPIKKHNKNLPLVLRPWDMT